MYENISKTRRRINKHFLNNSIRNVTIKNLGQELDFLSVIY